MVLVVVLAEVMAGGLVVATLAALAEVMAGGLVVATLAALAEAVDSTAEVADSMAGAHSTVEAMGPMAAGMGTGAMVITGIMAIVGVMGTTGTTGTGTTMDIGVGAAGGTRGRTVVGVILGTAIPAGVTPIMALTTIRPMIIRAVVIMAAITAEQITETAIQTAQKCASCNADLRSADTTTVLLMEQWVLKRDKQSGLTSVSTVIDLPRPSALIE